MRLFFPIFFCVWVTYELSVVAADSLLGAVGTGAYADDTDGRAANTEERASNGNGSCNSQESRKFVGIGLRSLQLGRSVSSRRQRMRGRTSTVLSQHCRLPLPQLLLARATMGPGAAAATEERTRTGKRRLDARMNMLTEL